MTQCIYLLPRRGLPPSTKYEPFLSPPTAHLNCEPRADDVEGARAQHRRRTRSSPREQALHGREAPLGTRGRGRAEDLLLHRQAPLQR